MRTYHILPCLRDIFRHFQSIAVSSIVLH